MFFALISCRSHAFFIKNQFNLFICVQIENHRLEFRERAQSKCGTVDYLDHRPSGGDKKVFNMNRRVHDIFLQH